jgi:lipopolysaccharide/colanic/teichoic acid biosynthesis glycosyltransferase
MRSIMETTMNRLRDNEDHEVDFNPQQVLKDPVRAAGLVIKRVTETVVSILLAIAISPVIAIVALAVRLTSPGPLFYRQKRVGIGGRQFDIIKFRTMYVGSDRQGPAVTAAGDPRITPIGVFLRKSKLDEIPQLFNVIRGDMSLVGPRPQVPKFVNHFDEKYKELVLSVRPGVTGPTSLCFRHEEQMLEHVSDQEAYYIDRILPMKLEMDAWYVLNRSMPKDAAIVCVTVWLLCSPVMSSCRRKLSPFTSGQQNSEARQAASLTRVLDRFLPSHLVNLPAGLLVVSDKQSIN